MLRACVCMTACRPCARTNFVFRQTAVDIDTWSSRCSLSRDSASIDVASCVAQCGIRAESRSSCWEKPHLYKKSAARSFCSLYFCKFRAYRNLFCEIYRNSYSFFYFFTSPVRQFNDQLTSLCRSIALLRSFFMTLSDIWAWITDMRSAI